MCLRYCIRKKTKLYTRCSVHKYFRTLSFDELEITESLFTACLFCNTQPNKKLTVKSGLRPSNHKIVSFWWLLSNHDLWCIWSLTDVIILSRPLLATILWIIQTRVSWSWVVVMAAFWICCAPGTNQRWPFSVDLKNDKRLKYIEMIEIDEVVMRQCAIHMRETAGDSMDSFVGDNYRIWCEDCIPRNRLINAFKV